jgi:hypothetical protein
MIIVVVTGCCKMIITAITVAAMTASEAMTAIR